MKFSSAIGLPILSLVACVLLAACGPGGNGAAPGEIVYNHGNGAEPKSLDQDYMQGDWEDNIGGDMLIGLTTQDANGDPIPGAATSWEQSADGLTWTFHLRDHLWSDGVPVTAEDFLYAWRRILDPKIASGYAYFLYPIKNAEAINGGKMPTSALGASAPDDKTIVVTLEHPAAYLPQFMMHMTLWPLPKHVVEKKGDAWSKPGNYVANGPFVLAEWVPNDHVTLIKNPKFYDAANVHLNRVIFYPTTDAVAALKRFRNKELDVQDGLPATQIDWLRANMPNALHLNPKLTVEYFTLNFKHKPLDDVRVREALSLALDRETIETKIVKLGEPPAYSMIPPGTADYPGHYEPPFKALSQAERLKMAQDLMKAAGYGPDHPLQTTLMIRSASSDALRIPVAIQQMWHQAYIEVQIVQLDAAVFYDKVQSHDFDIAEAGWVADFNDASNFLDLLRDGNSNNYGGYKNAEFNALLDKANFERDTALRGQMLAQAETLAMNDYAWVPISFAVSTAITQPYVKGWVANTSDKHRSRWISLER